MPRTMSVALSMGIPVLAGTDTGVTGALLGISSQIELVLRHRVGGVGLIRFGGRPDYAVWVRPPFNLRNRDLLATVGAPVIEQEPVKDTGSADAGGPAGASSCRARSSG